MANVHQWTTKEKKQDGPAGLNAPQNVLPAIMLIWRLPGLFLPAVDVGERVIESTYRQFRTVEVVGGKRLQIVRNIFRGELPGVGYGAAFHQYRDGVAAGYRIVTARNNFV